MSNNTNGVGSASHGGANGTSAPSAVQVYGSGGTNDIRSNQRKNGPLDSKIKD